jgi:hypothetical protein
MTLPKKILGFLAAWTLPGVIAVGILVDLTVPSLWAWDAKRTVTLVPDPDFGKGVDWARLFADYQGRGTYKDLVRTSDGRWIITDTRTYNFLFFDANGRFVKKLWDRGRRKKESLSIYGRPEWISLWKDRLFVSEVGVIRIFDLKGKEIRSAKVDHPVQCFEALDEKTVAVAGWVLRKDLPNLRFAAVIDLLTGKEIVVMDLSSKEMDEAELRYSTEEGKKITITLPFATVRPFVRRLPEGSFLAGFSNWPEIEIYDKAGGRIGDFILKTERTALDRAIYEDIDRQIREQQEERDKLLESQGRSSDLGGTVFRRRFGAIVVSRRLPSYAPYYYNLNVDEHGNLRVFYFPKEGENPVLQAYSDEGELRDEIAVDPGDFRIVFSPGAQGPVFDGEFLYALAEKKEAKGVPLRFMKFRMAEK